MCNRGSVPVTIGVDVGGPAKGFDVAVVRDASVAGLESRCDRAQVLALIAEHQPGAVGIDSPCRCASPGQKSRPGERALAREVCPIFYTPEEAVVRSGHPFYAWMVEGLDLYAEIEQEAPGTRVTEVFPSAAWTVWAGRRNGRSKGEWSREALGAAGAQGVPGRCSQDARDAIGAALVAGLFCRGGTVDYGGIAVPAAGSVALAG